MRWGGHGGSKKRTRNPPAPPKKKKTEIFSKKKSNKRHKLEYLVVVVVSGVQGGVLKFMTWEGREEGVGGFSSFLPFFFHIMYLFGSEGMFK